MTLPRTTTGGSGSGTPASSWKRTTRTCSVSTPAREILSGTVRMRTRARTTERRARLWSSKTRSSSGLRGATTGSAAFSPPLTPSREGSCGASGPSRAPANRAATVGRVMLTCTEAARRGCPAPTTRTSIRFTGAPATRRPISPVTLVPETTFTRIAFWPSMRTRAS